MARARPKKNLKVPYALAVFGRSEREAVARVLKTPQITAGYACSEFEKKVAGLFGKKFGVMVNSGSSANLLATELLSLPEGSEIITPILTFATTLAPLLQKRLVPVFVDAVEGSYLADIDQIERAISPRTRALVIPSLLGNIPDLERLSKIAKSKNIYFVEDSCDTLGAIFKKRPTGSYSDISTTSFYGSHIITACGGGGMVMVNKPKWVRDLKILRGWGRASAVTESEDIEYRYKSRLGSLPYDAKFIFEKIGYNFLPLEVSAAFGLSQLKKLSRFSAIRKRNFTELYRFFKGYEEFFTLPQTHVDADTNWLAFPLTICENAPFSRMEIVKFLEQRNIQTRPIFTGTVIKHPAFREITAGLRRSHPVADKITEGGFIVGCHQGLEEKHLNYMKNVFIEFLSRFTVK